MRISEAAERAQTERCFDKAKALATPLSAESCDDSSGGGLGDGEEHGVVNIARESAGVVPPNGEHGRGREQEQEQGREEEAVLTEPFVAWCVSRDVSPRSGLFVSASMPCRDLDSFADSLDGKKRIGGAERSHGACFGRRRIGRMRRVATNRGVNGIDGVISSAMGYADGLRSPVTLLIGDIATLHDLGSLHALVRGLNDEDDTSDYRITVVCVNNSGKLLLRKSSHSILSPHFTPNTPGNNKRLCYFKYTPYHNLSTFFIFVV